MNPTIFVESVGHRGDGFGVTAESDWLRLLMWLRAEGGVGEIYTQNLALAPGSSIDFFLTITPVTDGDGYWSFINALRRRWRLNGYTVRYPNFMNYARAGISVEQIAKALGHLGPITLVLPPNLRIQYDAGVVRRGRYPRLPKDAPRAPGACPDFDLDEFLTFHHREAQWRDFAMHLERIRKACPQVKVLQRMHPAMEVIYKPLADRWPFSSEAILTSDGTPFEWTTYTRNWLKAYADKDWAVLYYVPRPGSTYLQYLLREVRVSLDKYGTDGIYCDEFSWAGRKRGYSRYDYSRWDGYSADLDQNGNVLRLKSDNAFVTESAQLQLAYEVLRRGKIFLVNGGAALRSGNDLPIARFVEGGLGYGEMADAHLSKVPLVLGNFGDRKSQKGIFESVKACLSNGCIYVAQSFNLLLKGPDNFYCKLYPITIRKIGPGVVEADERLITTRSGKYDWPGRTASVRIYRYNEDGDLIGKDDVVEIGEGGRIEVAVPKGGLVIAEIVR